MRDIYSKMFCKKLLMKQYGKSPVNFSCDVFEKFGLIIWWSAKIV